MFLIKRVLFNICICINGSYIPTGRGKSVGHPAIEFTYAKLCLSQISTWAEWFVLYLRTSGTSDHYSQSSLMARLVAPSLHSRGKRRWSQVRTSSTDINSVYVRGNSVYVHRMGWTLLNKTDESNFKHLSLYALNLNMPPSLGRCSRHVQWGGDLGEDPGLGGEIISQHWPGNASGSPPS